MFGTSVGDHTLLSRIKLLSPGTRLRKALDDILKAKFGALILFVDEIEKYESMLQGGFRFDIAFSPEKLYELAKMDGALILDQEGTKILGANIHIVPDSSIPTSETGTRHRTAERIARQTECMVIAVSHRRSVITVYYKNNKYILNDTSFLIPRVSQALNTLDKYRQNFDKLITQIDFEGFGNLPQLRIIVEALSKGVEILKIREQIEPYLIELGIEGKLAKMQLEEIVSDMNEILTIFLMDYCNKTITDEDSVGILNSLRCMKELGPLVVGRTLGYDIANVSQMDEITVPTKGYRILITFARIPMSVSHNVVEVFKNVCQFSSVNMDTLKVVEGIGQKRAQAILDTIENFKQRRYT